MKIAIVGSREFVDYNRFVILLKAVLPRFVNLKTSKFSFVSGGARGVDRMAEQFCEENEYECKVFKANWDLYGKSAGFIRNAEIVRESDLILAFWDGYSRGTLDTIQKATQTGKIVCIIGLGDEVL